MNTIEQAAKRLEQLRQTGIDVSAAPSAEGPTDAIPQARANAGLSVAPAVAERRPGAGLTDLDAEGQERRSKGVELNLLKMQQAGLLVPGQPRSMLEDELRIIKRPLLDNVRASAELRPQRANLIMVSSATDGEGKTQTALNLAMSIAMELDHTVLLVDADVLRPAALNRMGVDDRAKGLLDLLANPKLDLADVMLRTNVPKLTLMPAGTSSTRSTELLASDSMHTLLQDLEHRYADRVIIFDAPPILSTTESRVLAAHMGQVVVVVEAYRTPISLVKEAMKALADLPVVMTLLNKYQGPKGGGGYGYGYGYHLR